MANRPIEVLSLGAGVQSSYILLASCLGEMPKLDHAIFADTGWEPAEVYAWLAWLRAFAEERGVEVHVVGNRSLKSDALRSQVRGRKDEGRRWASLPYFVETDGKEDEGQIRRQCTKEYKIEPINRFIRAELLGLAPRQRAPVGAVRQWFGISFDEWHRMRTSDVKWRTHFYPLVETKTTRHACLDWLYRQGFRPPQRSACIGCPYHSDAEWRRMKLEQPAEFEDACQFDEAIRHMGGMRGRVYLHRSLMPLREVDLRTDFDKGQLPLFQSPECDGWHCMDH